MHDFFFKHLHPLSTVWQFGLMLHVTTPTQLSVMLCLAAMHKRQSRSTCDRQLACYCARQFQLRHCTAESPLQQATETAAKKLVDADKPQPAAPAAAPAADKPQAAAAAAAATAGQLPVETEATPSAQDGPGEAPLLQEDLCEQRRLVMDLTISLTLMQCRSLIISTVSW